MCRVCLRRHRTGKGAAEGAARARADPPDCGGDADARGAPQVDVGPTRGVGHTPVGATSAESEAFRSQISGVGIGGSIYSVR